MGECNGEGDGVWDLVKLPKDRKTVGSKWVFKTKKGAKTQGQFSSTTTIRSRLR